MVLNDNFLLSPEALFALIYRLPTTGRTEVTQQELLSRYIKHLTIMTIKLGMTDFHCKWSLKHINKARIRLRFILDVFSKWLQKVENNYIQKWNCWVISQEYV